MIKFINQHELVYVVEQNRDAQLRSLLILDGEIDPKKLIPVLHYNGLPIHAGFIVDKIIENDLDSKSSNTRLKE